MPSNPNFLSQPLSLSLSNSLSHHNDDDDFEVPISQSHQKTPLKPLNASTRHRKKPKRSANPGKENADSIASGSNEDLTLHENCSLDLIESSIIGCSYKNADDSVDFSKENCSGNGNSKGKRKEIEGQEFKKEGYFCNSIEARLMRSGPGSGFNEGVGGEFGDFEEESELDLLIKLCSENDGDCAVKCPLCGVDISNLNEESRLIHTNDCLDKQENDGQEVVDREEETGEDCVDSVHKNFDDSPVVKWLRILGLEKYEEVFVREEIDWESLKWLTEEDLFIIGITALGPRKKIVHALDELRKGGNLVAETHRDTNASVNAGSRTSHGTEIQLQASTVDGDETSKSTANKLITDFFPGSVTLRKKSCSLATEKQGPAKNRSDSVCNHGAKKHTAKSGKRKDIPLWCSIPGTSFRVDAFKYLRGDCSHWFLTHFHMDHYQGLTRSFCHGKIYCSSITARLVNMRIGVPWDRLQVLPLNQKISIAGVDVTCWDANHCPGSIIILFEPANGKAVLHTGDFRFCEKMASMTALQMTRIHTLILDTTYCNPQYDFPKQEAVIQFVVEAIQAESFNPKTLFLIGSYTIGKERLFLEVARVLRRKVYVTAAKFRLLESLGFSKEDMQWFTLNEFESQIHVVPMWTLASFKRLKHMSNQYASRFSLIVAFSPTGWTFGKGKKKSPGRRWQQGTIIRYEVPYSEHCSFTELREFVKLASPEKIIPSVNNDGPESADTMVSLLLS
ncbi:DNA cross-link repair protein pso2/snm1 [Mercurialis annua]|uniref:DNA cross-link repair protein pso2/snm1 n=1 Tax=Mercurialis annua TaxID=3986 RepID=UPI0021601102|nr:DNA cross-link repair protein pso2/snm1 [Mercurialis annua]